MSMSFTVSCTICWVTFSSTIGKEFFLGGGSGPWLVEGNANSVPGVAMLLSSEVNLVSNACNLLVIKVLILGVSNFLSLNICTTGLSLLIWSKPCIFSTEYMPNRGLTLSPLLIVIWLPCWSVCEEAS